MISSPSRRKIREKTIKSDEYDFARVIQILLHNLKIILETISAVGIFHYTIIEGVVNRIFRIFEIFRVYLGESLIFLYKNFFGSKILSNSCCTNQKFDHKCYSYPGSETKCLNFGNFLTFFGIFEIVYLDTSL